MKLVAYKRYLRAVTKTPNDVWSWPSYHVNCKYSFFKTSIIPIIGMKNSQSSVSDADREIPTLGSTANAGNEVNLVSGIIRLPEGWDFSANAGIIRLPEGWDFSVYIGDR